MMKVLLVSPMGKNLKGGIAQWTEYIWNHSQKQRDEVNLDLLYFDKAIPGYATDSIFKRIYKGVYNYLSLLKLYQKQLKEKRYDVIHVCTSGSLTFIRDLLFTRIAKRKNIRVVLHTHFGRIPDVIKDHSFEHWLLKKLMNQGVSFAVMDCRTERVLSDSGCNVTYVPNPISQEIIEKGAAFSTKRSGSTILFVGHIVPTKGVTELIEACKSIPQAELLLCGPIPNPEYEKEIKTLANERIHFLGTKTHDEIIQLMSEVKVFALPSYTEGFPNVILEAMACKCPIVASNVGAIPEMLSADSDPYGICIESKNVNQLRISLKRCLNDSEQSSAMAEKAYSRVVERYSVSKVWEQLVEIWKN